MDRKKLLSRIVFLIFLIFVLHRTGTHFYWYYTIWWFDMIMHFLGGFFLGLLYIYLFSYEKSVFKHIFEIILSVFLVGILWEIFELYFVNHIAQNSFDLLDTISDIFFDLAGGLLAVFYVFKKIMPNPISRVQLK